MDKLILGSKPLSSMTDDELRAGIAQLQELREALVSDMRKAKTEPKPKAPPKVKQVDPFQAQMLAMLKGEVE